MKKDKTSFILVLFFFIGLAILFYPALSNYTNRKLQSKAITHYEDLLDNIEKEDLDNYFDEAIEYNEELQKLRSPFIDYDMLPGYDDILNVDGNGMIGYVIIDKIHVELTLYHGTSSHTLNSSAGLLEGSSFPTGTVGTHSVILAHRGLPSSKLFTDLDKLELGDTFKVRVYNKVFTYEVDQIKIIKPDEIDNIRIDENEEYVTLMTCTPYGINTHRLLVRGKRVENAKESPYVSTEAFKVDKVIVCSVMFLPLLVIWMILIAFKPREKNINYKDLIIYDNKKGRD